ncbi:hypothetical protein Pfo_014707 [Paulownia fortunei]|nr:hypothetical protein Pfo_014707 [Paulownia fortunei]
MSRNYDNWERLVAAVLRREQLWKNFHEQSKSPSITSISSDCSPSLSGQTPIDLSSKQLTGRIPVNRSVQLLTPVSFADDHLNPLPVPSTAPPLSRVDTGATEGGAAGGKAILSAAPTTKLAWYRRRKPRDHSFDVPAKEDAVVHLGEVTRFSLRQLQVATDNFSNKNLLRRVGSGVAYKGRLADGSLVEVIRVKEEHTRDGERQFQREVKISSMAAHRNLLCLLGFCKTPTERLLVYPFMVNGSVAACLRGKLHSYSCSWAKSQPPLDWRIRKRIALGSARGLVYLHEHCDHKIIHCGIRAANILLDEEFEAFVGNFKLAKLVEYKKTSVTTAVYRTIGHIAPEYLSSFECPEKTDVFSYGVMLLELITGLEDFELARLAKEKNVILVDWVKGLVKDKKLGTLVDAALKGNNVEVEVEHLTKVALLCTQRSPLKRPKMSEILRMLEGDLLGERWEKLHKEDVILQELIQTSLPNMLLTSHLKNCLRQYDLFLV